jgi:hypothetical protein
VAPMRVAQRAAAILGDPIRWRQESVRGQARWWGWRGRADLHPAQTLTSPTQRRRSVVRSLGRILVRLLDGELVAQSQLLEGQTGGDHRTGRGGAEQVIAGQATRTPECSEANRPDHGVSHVLFACLNPDSGWTVVCILLGCVKTVFREAAMQRVNKARSESRRSAGP